jgi:eukaryotic-like serine/threonine-protein kinase
MSELDLPPQIGGRYRPIRLIGKGGMGTVYEVEHLHTGQRFALKVLTPQPGASIDRFKREARAASRIRSDHIVQVTDADVAPELGSAPYLVMELLEGSDLEGVTGKDPASPEDVIGWLRQVARALAKAHEAGIIHRDLKPENLFLTRREDGSPLVKILDFGIAKIVAEGSTLTQSGGILGTPAYMAPEQTDSRGPPVTKRADLYALGLIAFKLLTGRMYWRNGSLAQLLAQILAEPMPPASERGSTLGPAFDEWFRRACDRDPDKRFASAVEQVEALAVVFGLPEQAPGISTPSPRTPTPAGAEGSSAPSLNASATDLTTARKRLARRRWLAGGSAVALAGVAIVGLSMRAGEGQGGPPPGVQSLGSRPSADSMSSSMASLTTLPEASAAAADMAPARPDAAAPASSSATLPASAKASIGAPPTPRKPGAAPTSRPLEPAKARDPLEGPY